LCSIESRYWKFIQKVTILLLLLELRSTSNSIRLSHFLWTGKHIFVEVEVLLIKSEHCVAVFHCWGCCLMLNLLIIICLLVKLWIFLHSFVVRCFETGILSNNLKPRFGVDKLWTAIVSLNYLFFGEDILGCYDLNIFL